MKPSYYPRRRKSLPNTRNESLNQWRIRYAFNLLSNGILNRILIEFFQKMIPEVAEMIEQNYIELLSPEENKINRHGRDHRFDNLLDLLERDVKVQATFRQSIILAVRQSGVLKKFKKNGLEDRLSGLAGIFDFNPTEIAIIRLSFISSITDFLETMLNDGKETGNILDIISILTDFSRDDVRRAIDRSGKLRNLEIMSINRHNTFYPALEEDFNEYLSGISDLNFAEKYSTRFSGNSWPLASFNVQDNSISAMKQLLQSPDPVNILFYGVEGTGKTELAKALCSDIDREAVFISQGEDGTSMEIKLALEYANKMYDPSKTVIIMDEADEILNTQNTIFGMFMNSENKNRVRKGWLNQFLEKSRQKIVWITNKEKGIEQSVKRRFHFSLKFTEFTAKERYELWKRIIVDHPLQAYLTDDFLGRMSQTFKVNAAGITGILQSASSAVTDQDKSVMHIETLIEELTARHGELLTGSYQWLKSPDKKEYDPSVLKTSFPVDKTVHSVVEFFKNDRKSRQAMNLLFYGLPGTGKTEFAHHLSRLSGHELIIKTSSDLINPYVGVTEMNIRDAFMQAEKKDAILLIDEIDIFLGNRKNASQRYETSMTAEFLRHMESFHGILIGTTNLTNSIDKAAIRRFAYKTEFLPLDSDGRVALYKRYAESRFGNQPHLYPPDIELAALLDIPMLAPGDFKTVFARLGYYAPSEVTPAIIAGELMQEARLKKEDTTTKKLGFR